MITLTDLKFHQLKIAQKLFEFPFIQITLSIQNTVARPLKVEEIIKTINLITTIASFYDPIPTISILGSSVIMHFRNNAL